MENLHEIFRFVLLILTFIVIAKILMFLAYKIGKSLRIADFFENLLHKIRKLLHT